MSDFLICSTCGVEHATENSVCAICADSRQYVPLDGQKWTCLEELRDKGCAVVFEELESDLYGITCLPSVGIGQQSKLIRTLAGNVLWDPIGYVDDAAARRVSDLGPVVAIVASHPHMYGVQKAWSDALDGVPILVSQPDQGWVQRPGEMIETFSKSRELVPGVTLLALGGHFPGSSVLHWAPGCGGAGVLLSSDTIFVNSDRITASFMRSYPNRIPLSAKVVQRLVQALDGFEFERMYGNFDTVIDNDAKARVVASAERHVQWIEGEFDHLT